MKVFLDANILFSAAGHLSATRKLLSGLCLYAEVVTNHHAWEEAHRNLLIKRPDLAGKLHELLKFLAVSEAFIAVSTNVLPEQDIPILAGALGSRCSHLWTGDKRHFGRWYGKKLNGVAVVSSILLADILLEKGWKP
jgi:uncharacterized protein